MTDIRISVSAAASDLLKDVEKLEESREYWIKRARKAEAEVQDLRSSNKYSLLALGPKKAEEESVFSEVEEKVDREISAYEAAREAVISEALNVEVDRQELMILDDETLSRLVLELQKLNREED